MNYRRAYLLTAGYVLAVLALSATMLGVLGPRLAHAASTPVRCAEDQACWTWSTMGNLRRGVTTTRGTHRVVSPCTFAYLSMRGRIDWTNTEHLRGDGFARRHGCNPRMYAD